jgi:hypothetical protein
MSSIQNEAHAFWGGQLAGPAGHEDAGRLAAAEGGRPAPILDINNQKLSQGPGAAPDEAIARKVNCRFVWCAICFIKFYLNKYYERLLEIPWDEARTITLTLDRLKVGSGADAYLWFRKKRALGRFIQNLKRHGIIVKDWAGVMEFHVDGTPHWHLLVRTKAGPEGRIGNEVLLKAWPWGIVHEGYFETEHDYNANVGYFGKAGYFHKGKEHQTVLPDYFKSEFFRGMKVPRFHGARKKTHVEKNDVEPSLKVKPCQSIPGLRSSICGKYTDIYTPRKIEDSWGVQTEYKFSQRIAVPYGHFKAKVPGDYQQGIGYKFLLSRVPPEVLTVVPFKRIGNRGDFRFVSRGMGFIYV